MSVEKKAELPPRRPGRPPNSDAPKADKFATLRAWVHWVMKNPLDEDQLAHAKATNDLFSLVGTKESILTAAEEKLRIAREALIKEAPEWKTCKHDYEPNTTMDYFRCDKCGARPSTVEALVKLGGADEREA